MFEKSVLEQLESIHSLLISDPAPVGGSSPKPAQRAKGISPNLHPGQRWKRFTPV